MRAHTSLDSSVVARFEDLVGEIKFAMLTTTTADGALRSRPMAVLKTGFDGDLWFFTADDAPKVDEILEEQQVGLSFAEPQHQKYVSVSGRASIVRDPKKQEELWTPVAKAWFPRGPHDPHLALLRVRVDTIEYWDSPSSKMVRLWALTKAALGAEKPAELRDHRRVDLPPKSELM